MELRVVTTEKGKILVDESAEIKENTNTFNEGLNGDWFYNSIYKSIARIGDITAYDFKIIATINHSISLDVPMIIVEKAGVYDGFKAKQKGVYSEEDLISFGKKCFYKGFNKSENDDANCFTAWKEEAPELIMDLKQEYIELEMEYLSNDGNWKGVLLPSEWEIDTKTRIKTNRVDGQLMAYAVTIKL
jgi:hypothetical protein